MNAVLKVNGFFIRLSFYVLLWYVLHTTASNVEPFMTLLVGYLFIRGWDNKAALLVWAEFGMWVALFVVSLVLSYYGIVFILTSHIG